MQQFFSALSVITEQGPAEKISTLFESPVDGVASDIILDLDSDSVPNEAVTLALFENAFIPFLISASKLVQKGLDLLSQKVTVWYFRLYLDCK